MLPPGRERLAANPSPMGSVAKTMTIGVVFVALAGPIVSLFTSDPTVRSYAVGCLRIVALGFPFYAYGMVLTSAFNGAGDTWTPTWINLGCFWCWELPLAYVLAHYAGLGPYGVFWAAAIAFSIFAELDTTIAGGVSTRARQCAIQAATRSRSDDAKPSLSVRRASSSRDKSSAQLNSRRP